MYEFVKIKDTMTHIEARLAACKTDEERVFVHMFMMNVAAALTEASRRAVAELSSKCTDRVAPQVDL